jgi:hypothetical protein
MSHGAVTVVRSHSYQKYIRTHIHVCTYVPEIELKQRILRQSAVGTVAATGALGYVCRWQRRRKKTKNVPHLIPAPNPMSHTVCALVAAAAASEKSHVADVSTTISVQTGTIEIFPRCRCRVLHLQRRWY